MNILHAHWQPPTSPAESGAFCLWSETTDAPPPTGKIDRRLRTPRPHPFAGTGADLKQQLSALTGLSLSSSPGSINLRLPTLRSGPQPSPHLLHTWELDSNPPILLPWEIPCLCLELADALYLLLNLPSAGDLLHDLRLGDDLLFWQAAARLALEALAQQKVQPALVADADGKNLYARWTPVLDGPHDGPRLARLQEALPPLCRAATDDETPPRFLIDSFLAGLTDGLMRRWNGATPANHKETSDGKQFLAALSRQDARLQLSPAQSRRLHTSYQAWVRNLHVAGDANFRVALRLQPPAPHNGDRAEQWTLHFLLQARDDPSLLVEAAQVWRSRDNLLGHLNRRLENPQELLLTGLGYVARHNQAVQRSLRGKNPMTAAMSGDEAYAYLRETAPLLEESGFGIFVPPWWNKAGARLGLRMKMSGSVSADSDGVGQGLMTMENLVRYRWELSLGGEALSQEEFDALVALKSPLVQIRGQWVQLDPEQIEAAIRFWEKMEKQKEIGLLEAAALTLDDSSVDGLPVEGVDTEGWLAEWMARFTGQEALEVLPVPQGLDANLRPYQSYGYSWLDFQRRWGIGVCLADDMGLGKTIQTLAMMQRAKEQAGQLPGPSLLIAPTSVVVNWAKEAARFTPQLRVLVHQGPERLRGKEFVQAAQEYDLVATSYALARRDEASLRGVDWFGLILDEAQNIKNSQTKQTRIIRQLPSNFRLTLTGTPVENRLSELWSIMHFLNPGFLGSRQHFRERFALPIERYDDEEAATRLRRLVSPFILRRVKSDPTVIQDLPDKQESKAYCYLSPEQATLYEAVVQDALQAIDSADEEIQRRGMVLSMLMKLKQICNHPAQFLHQMEKGQSVTDAAARSGKLARLLELLEELLAAGDRALVFSQFAEMGGFLHSFLQEQFGRPVLFLHGGTPAKQRNAMVERFQAAGDGPPIFVLSLKAGGTGLNLTQANHVFHYDRWWNPAVEDQATDRAFRIGQKQNVQVHKFVCVGTLEERIDAMIEQKKALALAIVGSGENWLTELSTGELRELVHLRREMVE